MTPRAVIPARPSLPPKAAPSEDLRRVVAGALEELKARDVREIDVRDKTSVTDYMVIASGTSSRHVKSIADEVLKQTKAAGVMPIGVEGEREGEWVLVDLGEIVVHVMLPRVREFYGLERLWTVGDHGPHSVPDIDELGAADAGFAFEQDDDFDGDGDDDR